MADAVEGPHPSVSGFAVATAAMMLLAGAALASLLAATAGGSSTPSDIRWRDAVFAVSVAAAGYGVLFLLLRLRTPRWLLFVFPPVASVLVCVPSFVGHQAMPVGAILLVWPVLFAGYLLPEHIAWVTLGVAIAALAVLAVRIGTGGGFAQCTDVALSLLATLYVTVHLRRHAATLMRTLRREARTDPLTGLPNRRAFDTFLDREMAVYDRHGEPLSLLAIDIDRFKRLNDRFGHPAGDAALAALATVLTEHVRRGDIVARVGGEEFAILFTDCPAGQAEPRAQALRAAVAAESRTWPHGITISIGVAALPDHAATAAELVAAADSALYRAKAAGRDTVTTA